MSRTLKLERDREGFYAAVFDGHEIVVWPTHARQFEIRVDGQFAGTTKRLVDVMDVVESYLAGLNPPSTNPAKDDGGYFFVHSCPNSTYEDMSKMTEQEQQIERSTFARKIGKEAWAELQANLGYDRSFPISKDWHVGYYKSKYREVPAVYLRHSRIEHIYTLGGELGPSLAPQGGGDECDECEYEKRTGRAAPSDHSCDPIVQDTEDRREMTSHYKKDDEFEAEEAIAALKRVRESEYGGDRGDFDDLELVRDYFPKCKYCGGIGGDPAGPCRAECFHGRVVPEYCYSCEKPTGVTLGTGKEYGTGHCKACEKKYKKQREDAMKKWRKNSR